jgi:hypothetical protein
MLFLFVYWINPRKQKYTLHKIIYTKEEQRNNILLETTTMTQVDARSSEENGPARVEF